MEFATKSAMERLERSMMARSFTWLLLVLFLGSSWVVAMLPLVGGIRAGVAWPSLLARTLLLSCEALIATALFYFLLKKIGPLIDRSAAEQARFLDSLDQRYAGGAIVVSAAVSLLLELAVIRWQSTVFEFLAYYKNFSLLACFLGLGLGYALASRDRIPLVLVIPLLGWQFAFMTIVRFGPQAPFRANPFREQLALGTWVADVPRIAALFALLTIVFLGTTLAFVPLGQLCGRLMERLPKLPAYGLNLLGSLVGVLAMLLASFLWTPPLVWFSLCILAILLFHARKPGLLIAGFVSAAVCVVVLAWPVEPLWGRIYSPYQLLEMKANEETGLTLIRAAGTYYQRIYDLSADNLSARWEKVRQYYELPYKARTEAQDVAVVGAGTGNDVAAAVRSGAGRIEAIEIDPAILRIGRENHPEKPYDNPRVHAVINDARSFFRQSNQKFDLIVYGMLDSHTLLTQGSSVRLDSFVYTVEGLREARRRLKPDGMISLSFSIVGEGLGRKMYLMLQQAFDGRPPKCIRAGYDESVIFLESNDDRWTLRPELLEQSGFADYSAHYASDSLKADVSTDDWPFFYMPRRVYPVSYLIMVIQILLLSLVITGSFLRESPQFSHISFFFLGVGFMLVETKGITEMGLTFGNTWQVIGVVIAGILAMAFLGNCAVQWLKIRRPTIPYLLLLAALGLGWLAARSGGFPSTPLGRFETCVVLTCPLLFSGIVFSTLLAGKGQISAMMASNLLGAICGGLLEYNSMYFGFRSLYVAAMACYFLAFASDLGFSRKEARVKAAAGAI